MSKYSGSGWHFQSKRHSRARKYGHAGGTYLSVYKRKLKKLNNTELIHLAQAYKAGNRIYQSTRFQKGYNDVIEELDARGLLKHSSNVKKGDWVEDMNGMESEIIGKKDGNFILKSYPDGFKFKVPEEKLLENFSITSKKRREKQLKREVKNNKQEEESKPSLEINTIYGKGKYSHTEDDKEFYSHSGDPYSYKNGYAVIHEGNAHHIYTLEQSR
jgi:hypothetical protein